MSSRNITCNRHAAWVRSAGQVMMTIGEQPQDRRVIIAFDAAQTAVTQPGDRRRQRIVRVVLRCSSTSPTNALVRPMLVGHRPLVHRPRRVAGRAVDRARRRTRSPTPGRHRMVQPTPTTGRSDAVDAGNVSRAIGCSSRSTATAVWVDLCGSIPIVTDMSAPSSRGWTPRRALLMKW